MYEDADQQFTRNITVFSVLQNKQVFINECCNDLFVWVIIVINIANRQALVLRARRVPGP